ncbi:hypothetical protein AK812_SmicGene33553 [Symbiodinium microadriaticum]|uniref:Uncharacterized protein n=1 Tax=Symbiodinium microadriaticum TaxID=2951 RepID=A0A1Q9CR89_SYMMI|nr:hypothetical protein AK812_SmicGene33553 [Symbiodinium microadriaticum]
MKIIIKIIIKIIMNIIVNIIVNVIVNIIMNKTMNIIMNIIHLSRAPCGQLWEASKKVSESQEKSTKRAPRPSPLSSHNQQTCDWAELDFENGEAKSLRPHLYYNYPTRGIYSG